MSNIE